MDFTTIGPVPYPSKGEGNAVVDNPFLLRRNPLRRKGWATLTE